GRGSKWRQRDHEGVGVSEEKLISGRVAVFCCSSAGELDVMLPLLHSNGVSDFRFYIFKKAIQKKIDEDDFYRELIGDRIEDRSILSLSRHRPGRWWQFITNSLSVLRKCWNIDRFCFEYG